MLRRMVFVLTAISGCAAEPVHADGQHYGQHVAQPPPLSQPIRRPPAPLMAVSYQFDEDGLVYSNEDQSRARLRVPAGYKRFGGGLAFDYAAAAKKGGNQGCGKGNGGPSGRKDCDPKPPKPEPPIDPPGPPFPPTPPDPLPDVPGPAGVLGAAAAFGWARRMRRRVGK